MLDFARLGLLLLLLSSSYTAFALKLLATTADTSGFPIINCYDISGGDLAKNLNSCLSSAPSTGAILDTSPFKGTQTLSETLLINKPVRIIIGCTTWKIGAEIAVSANTVSITGACENGSIMQRAPGYSGRLISYASPGHSGLEISGITFDDNVPAVKNSDTSAVVYLHSGNHETKIHHNRFVNLGGGRAISSGGSIVSPQQVHIEENTFAGAPVLAMIASDGAVRHSGVVTITTTAMHGLFAGNQIYISGTDDKSFEGVFTIRSVPTTHSIAYEQARPDSISSGGTVVLTNVRTISLVTPGFGVQIRGNTILGSGSITLEPSNEAGDGDIEVSGNVLQNVDATNILIRTRDKTRVEKVRVSNNHIQNAGLGAGKGCIAVGESVGTDQSSAFLRNASIVDNDCRGWGNWTGPSIGISVAGASGGATVENVVVSGNVLDSRRVDGAMTASGYGIFVRNRTRNFEIEKNRISYSGRSCIAIEFAERGEVRSNACEFGVSWAEALNPAPSREGCYQIDRGSSNLTITWNRCTSPGTVSGSTNGFFVADSETVHSVRLFGNAVITNARSRKFLIRSYWIGRRAKDVQVFPF